MRSPRFLDRFAAEAQEVRLLEPAIWQVLTNATDYIALSHWNAKLDNAWFWDDAACGAD